MPWVSEAQRRWGNSPAGHEALGDEGVRHWNKVSKNKTRPERIKNRSLARAALRAAKSK